MLLRAGTNTNTNKPLPTNIMNEQTKQKIAKAHTGKKHSDAHRKAVSDSKKGRKLSEEHKKSIQSALKGKKKTEAHRKALSDAKKGSKSHKWMPFKIVAHCPDGTVEEHVFESETPWQDCADKLGLVNFMKKLKNGGNVILKRKNKKVGWPKLTVVQLKLIKIKKTKNKA